MFRRRSIEALVLVVLLGAVGSAARAGEGMSLRERIAARQARIKAEAEAEAAAKARTRELSIHPDDDPRCWKIGRFAIPTKRMMGIPVATGQARFYATAPRYGITDDQGVGTTVYFYEYEGGLLRLAGLGEIGKIRKKSREVAVESFIRSFRYARAGTRNVRGSFGVSVNEAALTLVGNKNPENSQWYMSTELKGVDIEGWSTRHKILFSEQKGWVGMTENALRALGGPPSQTFEDGGQQIHIFRQLLEPSEATVKDGRVIRLKKIAD